jgi:hypothetical protein
VDLAKSVFQLHMAKQSSNLLFRKKLTRLQFEEFLTEHHPARGRVGLSVKNPSKQENQS